jgi:hypothetical protein
MGRLGFVADAMTSSRVDGAFIVQTGLDGSYTERLRIGSTGKIAIGNNIPMWSGSYGGALVLKGNDATADRYAQLGIVNSTGTVVYTGLVVDTVGQVGIGTTAPATKLDVQGGTVQFETVTDAKYRIHTATSGGRTSVYHDTIQLGKEFNFRMSGNGDYGMAMKVANWTGASSFGSGEVYIYCANSAKICLMGTGASIFKNALCSCTCLQSPIFCATTCVKSDGSVRAEDRFDLYKGSSVWQLCNNSGTLCFRNGNTGSIPIAITNNGILDLATAKLSIAGGTGSSGNVLTNADGAGTVCWSAAGSGTIGGSGTDNYIPRFNGTNALENSLIYDDGTNIGIGTNAPAGLLHLYKSSGYAQLRVETDDTTNNLGFSEIYLDADTSSDNQVWRIQGLGGSHSTDARKLKFYDGTAGATRMVIDSSGQVGIGTTAPTSSLDVYDADFAGGAKGILNVISAARESDIMIENDAKKYKFGVYDYGNDGTDRFFLHGETDGTTVQVWDASTGKVGIGTNAPDDQML